MKNVYVFFGHGWNTDKTVDISYLNNVKIILMKDACILYEYRNIKHLRNIMKVGKNFQFFEIV